MCIYLSVCFCVSVRACVCECMRVCVCMYVCTRACTCVYACARPGSICHVKLLLNLLFLFPDIYEWFLSLKRLGGSSWMPISHVDTSGLESDLCKTDAAL